MDLLSLIPYGRSNAVSRASLCLLTGWSDRRVRKAIEMLRSDHAIINLQDGEGYFQPLPEERSLVEYWMRQENCRTRSSSEITMGAEKWLNGGTGERFTRVRAHRRRLKRRQQIDGQMKL